MRVFSFWFLFIFVGAGFFFQTVYGYDPDRRENERLERLAKKQEREQKQEESEKVRKFHEIENLLGKNHSSFYERPEKEALRDSTGRIVKPEDINFSGSQKNYTYGTEEKSVPVEVINKGSHGKPLDLRMRGKGLSKIGKGEGRGVKEVPLSFDKEKRFKISSPTFLEKKEPEKVLWKKTLEGISSLEEESLEKEKEELSLSEVSKETSSSETVLPVLHRSSSGSLIKPAVQGMCEGTVDGMKNLAGDVKDLLLAAKDATFVGGKAVLGDEESQEKVKGVVQEVSDVSGKVLDVLAVLIPPTEEFRLESPEEAQAMDESRAEVVKQLKEKAAEFGEMGKEWGKKFLQAPSEDQARMISGGFGVVLSNLIPVSVVGKFKQVARGARALESIEGTVKAEKIGKGTQILRASEEEIERLNQAFLKELKKKGFLGKSKIRKVYNEHLKAGPLSKKVTTTFRNLEYAGIHPVEGEVLIRYGTVEGQYWTRIKPGGQIQSMMDNSVSPHFNDFSKMTKITIKKGFPWEIYEGESASLIGPIKDTPWKGPSSLVGGGNQVVIPDWVLEDPRFKKFVKIEEISK